MAPFLLPGEPIASIDHYLTTECGGVGLKRAHELGREQTIAEVAKSRLRGRGGGGFPTGRKWSSIAANSGTRYVVVNGAEGEPGTFKDRALMRANPYQLVEGLMIAAFAVGAQEAFIGIKETFTQEIERVTRAVEEMQQAGLCADCNVTIVHGPEEYLFGEEKALLEVIEGKPPLPRLFPPYEHGLFATDIVSGWQPTEGTPSPNPTLVNNVETLSNVPWILTKGAEWHRAMGTPESPGNVVATVVGDVVAPDVGEVELGTSLQDVIDAVGSGVAEGRRIKAVFSGVANPVMTDTSRPLTYEDIPMGAAGFIVYDDTACMVEVARQLSRFLWVESCGQCPPCKLGSQALTAHLARIEAGTGDASDIGELHRWIDRVTDGNRCYLAVEEQSIVRSVLTSFADEFEEHIAGGRCPRPRPIPLPLVRDMGGGRVVYEDKHYRKQPDWTYAPPA
jgi:NADH:ubiquinone oxidoreductase subunit F (NADH-binding)